MRAGFQSHHWTDAHGCPQGGATFGNGFTISWQNGALGREPDRKEPNGAFVEDVIAAALDRIKYYQQSRFACRENAEVIQCLSTALELLDRRTQAREERGVEGTHNT